MLVRSIAITSEITVISINGRISSVQCLETKRPTSVRTCSNMIDVFVGRDDFLSVQIKRCISSTKSVYVGEGGRFASGNEGRSDAVQVKVGGGKGANSSAQKNRAQEGYVLEYKVKRRIPLENVNEIKMRQARKKFSGDPLSDSLSSEYRDNFFLLCVNNDYATLLELSSKTEAISTIAKNYLKKTNRALPITFSQG